MHFPSFLACNGSFEDQMATQSSTTLPVFYRQYTHKETHYEDEKFCQPHAQNFRVLVEKISSTCSEKNYICRSLGNLNEIQVLLMYLGKKKSIFTEETCSFKIFVLYVSECFKFYLGFKKVY